MVQQLWKTVWQFLKILNIDDPRILLLGILPRELRTPVHTNTWMRMFIAGLFTIAKKWKWLKCPSLKNESIEWGISIYEILFGNKKKGSMNTWNIMDEPGKHYKGKSQLQRTAQCMIPFKEKVQNKQNYSDRKRMVSGTGGNDEWLLTGAEFLLGVIKMF